MATKFAALESRLTTAVFVHLSNAEAMLGGVLVAGIFDNGYAEAAMAGLGVASANPTWMVPTASVPEVIFDYLQNYSGTFDPLNLMIKFAESGPSYRIVSQEPDGTGITILHLRT